jgi:hypothetical protein
MASVGMDDLRSLRRKILSAASRSYSAICAGEAPSGWEGDLQARPGVLARGGTAPNSPWLLSTEFPLVDGGAL